MAIGERVTGLAASASRGAAVTLGAQLIRASVQLVGIVVLARLLTPDDYGVLAMVLAIIGVGEVFRDFGLSSAAVQAKTVSRAQQSNLFWLNSGIGLVMAGLVCAFAGPIAAFYGDERLQLVAIVLSSTFVLNGVATQFRARLNRDLRFVRLSIAEIAAQVGSLGVGIWMAVAGYGYWALVGQQVSLALVQAVIVAASAGWWPGLPRRAAEMGGFLRFGGNLVGSQLITYASRNVDAVIIGSTLGASALGVYNRAFQLMLMPLNQVNAPSMRVALPVLSRLQDSPTRFAEFLNVGQTFMLNLVGVILAFACAQADSLIMLALGPQWMAAVPVFQVLAIAGFFQAASYASYWVFLAKGLTGAHLRFSLATRPVMIGVILLGSLWGVTGVAIAFTVSTALLWPAALWWVGRVSDAPVRMMWRNGARTFVLLAVAAGASFAATFAIPADLLLVRLGVGAAVMLAVILVAWLLIRPYRRDAAAMLAVRQYFRAGGRRTEPEEAA